MDQYIQHRLNRANLKGPNKITDEDRLAKHRRIFDQYIQMAEGDMKLAMSLFRRVHRTNEETFKKIIGA